jgi:hypothetical protein
MKAKGEENNFKLGIKSFFGGRILFVFLSLLGGLFFLKQDTQAATVSWVGASSNASTSSNITY